MLTGADELLVRERQQELLREAAQYRLAAEARRASGGSHFLVRLKQAAAHLRAAARLHRRLA